MQDQLTVRLPEDLRRRLRVAARRMQRTPSDIVRMALREFFGAGAGRPGPPAERVRHLLGSLESGVSDLAERHRDYILETLERGR